MTIIKFKMYYWFPRITALQKGRLLAGRDLHLVAGFIARPPWHGSAPVLVGNRTSPFDCRHGMIWKATLFPAGILEQTTSAHKVEASIPFL